MGRRAQQFGDRQPRAGAEKPAQGIWQRFRPEGGSDKPADTKGGMSRGALRGNVVRERRGDRMILVVGELTDAELKKVMDSIPLSPGQAREGLRF